jgi:hypothetical protein
MIHAAVLSYVLHLDKHMHQLIASLGGWIYALLFTIVFAETGFVVRASYKSHARRASDINKSVRRGTIAPLPLGIS